jgi:glutaredoxin
MEWRVFTLKGCSYCKKAKDFLSEQKISFKEILIGDKNKTTYLSKTSKLTNGYTSFPQIFYRNKFIGGYSDLITYFINIPEKRYNETQNIDSLGTPEFLIKALNYLEHKYKDQCTLISSDIPNFDMLSLRWNQTKSEDGYISIPKNFWPAFEECLKHSNRFILIPFGFNCKEISKHSNFLIYDKSSLSLERFEPHGAYGYDTTECLNSQLMDISIKELFEIYLQKPITFYIPVQFCPIEGYQTIQEMENLSKVGFCSAWSIWYADLRLSNPDKERREVIDMSIKYLKTSDFTSFISNYTTFLHSKI